MLPALFFAFIPAQAQADPLPGLNAVYYTIDEVPPIQSDDEYIQCGMEIENNINRSYDGEPIDGCPDDMFMVHLTGFITIPEHDTIEFFLASDDGGEATIGDNTWGSWTDQGCSAWMSGSLDLEAASIPLEIFMYENGGGACLMLAWKIDNNDWEIVPDEAFTTNSIPTTTTTSTTTSTTTTTIPETTTTSTTTTSTTTTTTTTSTTTTTTTIVVPTQTTASPPPETVPEPPETVPEPPTTVLIPDTVELPPTTIENVPETTAPEPPDTVPAPPETVDTMPEPPDTVPEPPDTLPEPPDTVPEPPDTVPELTDATDEEINSVISQANVEELNNIIEEIKTVEVLSKVLDAIADEPISASTAISIIENDNFEQLSTEQIQEVFANIEIQDFTEEQEAELVALLNEASDTIKESFEEEVNIFAEGVDDYIPSGSIIDVGTRRTLIAATAAMSVAVVGGTPSTRRKK
jgi:hypothetical protein